MPILHADHVIHSPDGRFSVAIEIKNYLHMDRDTAIELRRYQMNEGLLPVADFLLIVSQDVGFLWTNHRDAAPDAPPALQFPTAPIIARLVPSLPRSSRLNNSDVDFLIRHWLERLGDGVRYGDPVEQDFLRLGFIDAIRDGLWLSGPP